MTLLVRSIREGLRPRPAFVRVPLLLPGEISTTDVEPMKSLLARVGEIEQLAGILTAEILVGFAWADAAHASSSVAVIAEDEAHLPRARHEVKRLAQAMWDERHNFTFDQEVAASADESIDLALAAEERTVFIADSGDNPTAGTPGDVTHFLSRLLAKGAPDAVLAGIPDVAAARACFERGVGATVTLSLGGKLDSEHGGPLDVTGVVEHLYRPGGDGKEAGHCHAAGGRCAGPYFGQAELLFRVGRLSPGGRGAARTQDRGGQAGLPDAGAARRGAARDPGVDAGVFRHGPHAAALPTGDASGVSSRQGVRVAAGDQQRRGVRRLRWKGVS